MEAESHASELTRMCVCVCAQMRREHPLQWRVIPDPPARGKRVPPIYYYYFFSPPPLPPVPPRAQLARRWGNLSATNKKKKIARAFPGFCRNAWLSAFLPVWVPHFFQVFPPISLVLLFSPARRRAHMYTHDPRRGVVTSRVHEGSRASGSQCAGSPTDSLTSLFEWDRENDILMQGLH